MKASELIEKLQQLIVEHGDLYVFESFSGDASNIKQVYYEFEETFVDEPAAIILA